LPAPVSCNFLHTTRQKIGVRDQQIEKDYILSWILFGISKHEQLSKAIVFKGGTVLKKVYFNDYRFSEDLDFTLLNNDAPTSSAQASNDQIFGWFKQVFGFIKRKPISRLTLLIPIVIGTGMNTKTPDYRTGLLEEHKMEAEFYVNEFEVKCKSKGLKHTDFTKKLAERLPQYKGRWKNSLSEQRNNLVFYGINNKPCYIT